MKYWLMKTEPSTYGWSHLKNKPGRTDHWDGIRNYQARNYMREMEVGDRIFFYHSVCKPTQIVGIAEVVKKAYPDHTQFDANSHYFDPKSSAENVRWQMVDVRAHAEFDQPLTLDDLRAIDGLEDMVLLRKGSRLSVQPVSSSEWKTICNQRKIIKL